MPLPFKTKLPSTFLAVALALAIMAAPARADQTFTNSIGVNIIDSDGNGPAASDPYPSQISVSGVTGTVTAVSATLHGFAHLCPQDVDVLLVGPQGDSSLLMSDAGDCTEDGSRPAIDLSFDDSASLPVPCLTDGTDLTGGTYRPADYEDHDCVNPGDFPDGFPAPAPLAPWPTNLAGFAGKDPNGTWSLYVVDDQSADAGAIHGGWSLSIATAQGSGGGSPAIPPPAAPQPQPPAISTKARLTQSVLKTHGVIVSLSSSSGGSLVATGTVSVPNLAKTYRFTTVRRVLPAGTVPLKLKLPASALRQVRRALAAHRRLSGKITLTLVAGNGEKTVRHLTIRLR